MNPTIWQRFAVFLSKYPMFTHFCLLLWATFMTTWATKTAIPFFGYTISATAAIGWLQYEAHAPTWSVALITGLLNLATLYANFKSCFGKKQDAQKLLSK